jgi:solute carrier family 30 (zinc transporter), member 5/7
MMKTKSSYATSTRKFLHHIFRDRKSRRILAFLLLNLIFMGVELLVGFIANSLGLISDAGHMFFDCTALFIGLFAAFAASWRADNRFTYGYARYEVLSGFVNGVFLIFVAFAVLTESLSRISEPPEVHSGHLLWTSITGLLINMIGLVFFHDFSHGGNHENCNGGHGHGSHGHSHGHGGGTDQNMRGIFLHILADALGSVGVVVSSILIKYFGWHIADPICSLMISGLILMSVVPLIQDTGVILLQQVPQQKEQAFAAALVEIRHMENVQSLAEPHMWSVRGGLFVTTLHVIVEEETTSERQQALLRKVVTVLKVSGANHTTVQISRVRDYGKGGGRMTMSLHETV